MAFSSMVVVHGDKDLTMSVVVDVQTMLDFQAMTSLHGFRHARLCLSDDRQEVVLLTEWDSRDDYQAWRQSAEVTRVIEHAMRWHPKITFLDVVAGSDATS